MSSRRVIQSKSQEIRADRARGTACADPPRRSIFPPSRRKRPTDADGRPDHHAPGRGLDPLRPQRADAFRGAGRADRRQHQGIRLYQPDPSWLLCGDSTVATDVERVLGGVAPHLMVTDPPYGVNYDPAWRDQACPKTCTGGDVGLLLVANALALERHRVRTERYKVARISKATALAASAALSCDPPASARLFPVRMSEIPRITPPLTCRLL